MKIKGMRDIRSRYGLSSKGIPKSREQIVAELARLGHHRSRLKRELDIWIANQQRTKERIQQVRERIALLQRSLNRASFDCDDEEESPAAETPVEKSDSPDTAGNGNSEGWREVSLEY